MPFFVLLAISLAAVCAPAGPKAGVERFTETAPCRATK